MQNLNKLNHFRVTTPAIFERFGSFGDHSCGFFEIPSTTDQGTLRVIASTHHGWDHVSVSRKNRCPNWPEMSQIKRLFFLPDETAVEFHVPESQHINCHPYCLHLWRSHTQTYELPPAEFVGPAST